MTNIQHATELTVLWSQNSFLVCCLFGNGSFLDCLGMVVIQLNWHWFSICLPLFGAPLCIRKAATHGCREVMCLWSRTGVCLWTQVLGKASSGWKAWASLQIIERHNLPGHLFLGSSIFHSSLLLGFLWGRRMWVGRDVNKPSYPVSDVGLPSSREWIVCCNRKDHLKNRISI